MTNEELLVYSSNVRVWIWWPCSCFVVGAKWACLASVVLFVKTNGMGKQRLKCLTTTFRTFQACFVNRVTSTDKAETLPLSIAADAS